MIDREFANRDLVDAPADRIGVVLLILALGGAAVFCALLGGLAALWLLWLTGHLI